MRQPFPRTAAIVTAVLALACLGIPAGARTCDVDAVPAATLLVPYFEVDTAALAPPYPPAAFTTVVTVTNTDGAPHVAHVTLWTDWAIPTAAFDLYLRARDVQSINLRDVFVGETPFTGPSTLCSGDLEPGNLHFNAALHPTGASGPDLERLLAAHTGAPIAAPGGASLLAGSAHADKAIGYVTIDAAKRCSKLFPSSSGYFSPGTSAGVAATANVLVGDWLLVGLERGTGAAEPVVHIRADGQLAPGDYTFYGRYLGTAVVGDRQALPNAFGTRQGHGEAAGVATDLVVWRDTKSPAVAPVAVGRKPHWFPLPLKRVLSCNEGASCSLLPPSTRAAPLATQRVVVGPGGGIPAVPEFGWLQLDLDHGRRPPGASTPLFGPRAQGWVVTLFQSELVGGPADGAMRAFRLPGAQTTCRP